MKSPAVFNFNESEWFTERTYEKNYKKVPKKPGVYLLVNRKYGFSGEKITYEILYVGSSKSLRDRYRSHQTLRILKEFYEDVIFYFIEEENYIELEKHLIKQTKARFNKQWL